MREGENLELEHKCINFEIKEIDDKGHFIGVASPYNNVDLGNDRVKSTIAPRNANKTVPYLWTHNVEEPIGTVKLISTDTGMNIDGQLFLDTSPGGVPVIPNAFKAYRSMKSGILSNSIGYNVMPDGYKYVTEDGQTIRDLTDIDIKEVSAVLFPMNEAAVISGVKSNNSGGDNLENKGASGSTSLPLADKGIKWDGPAAAKRIFDKYTDEDGNISAEAKKGFFWFDSSKPNNKTSYKLGFADIVDDKLTAIPAGVLAAANAIRGARNPVDIPDTDKKKCATKINKYLKKLEYSEITDDQIKGEQPKPEPKSSQNKLNIKALDFNAVYQTRQNREARWDAESALDQSLDSIVQDEEMAMEDKITAANNTIDSFSTMYKQVMSGLIMAMSQKALNYEFETKSAYMERKAGKKISKSNMDKIKKAMGSISDTLNALKEMVDMQDNEGKACGGKKPIKQDDTVACPECGAECTPDADGNCVCPDCGNEFAAKACKPKKSTQKSQNIEELQKKENDVKLEIKSIDNIKILEGISKLFKGDEQ